MTRAEFIADRIGRLRTIGYSEPDARQHAMKAWSDMIEKVGRESIKRSRESAKAKGSK